MYIDISNVGSPILYAEFIMEIQRPNQSNPAAPLSLNLSLTL